MAHIIDIRTHRPTISQRCTDATPSAGSPEARQAATPLKRSLDPREIYRALGEDCPDLYAAFRHEPTVLEELRDDWREFVRAVRANPYSHALVAIITIITWTAALVAPLLIGALS
jgi:hypothetical protein